MDVALRFCWGESGHGGVTGEGRSHVVRRAGECLTKLSRLLQQSEVEGAGAGDAGSRSAMARCAGVLRAVADLVRALRALDRRRHVGAPPARTPRGDAAAAPTRLESLLRRRQLRPCAHCRGRGAKKSAADARAHPATRAPRSRIGAFPGWLGE